MASTGYIKITETTDGGRTYSQRLCDDVADFNDATLRLHMWLWLNQSQDMSAEVIMRWMRGEEYAGHSVSVRYYLGTIGHWFEILYRA
jgi:hypothetical protein